ncbi:TPA: hypothetical protein HH295_20315 [Xanthomonas vasicola pv. zeae]|uniref:hypothetical protein n=1 Tax=Xanthomonas vasicola TaxID=56459 RepID=UPI0004780261|nr:hypothetical protein [Xanthomonas vasicola]KFA39438.1 hypothetical protein KWS_0103375 [Xanthomonas vasicola pv. musacearum NCPPB 4384]KFA05537.1 hypothetical protein KWM_0118785 [Xanthomonas vasicola pv. musacearum NCPPB 2005]KFA06241.1 hypothetical protein KWQ_0118530 [Xanthomonas vasicola pv. musacearum NCPPB 4380]KFA17240.1 hypothetical protein A11G_0115280 [Xanthomonas vasicola pv. musacearum NCPPB 4392]KFA26017.1 hypothetical protein KWU_0101120 [Xanthomonas vasicola pv. musacearum NC
MPLDAPDITTWAGGVRCMRCLHKNDQACLIAVREHGAAFYVPQREAELVGQAPRVTDASC